MEFEIAVQGSATWKLLNCERNCKSLKLQSICISSASKQNLAKRGESSAAKNVGSLTNSPYQYKSRRAKLAGRLNSSAPKMPVPQELWISLLQSLCLGPLTLVTSRGKVFARAREFPSLHCRPVRARGFRGRARRAGEQLASPAGPRGLESRGGYGARRGQITGRFLLFADEMRLRPSNCYTLCRLEYSVNVLGIRFIAPFQGVSVCFFGGGEATLVVTYRGWSDVAVPANYCLLLFPMLVWIFWVEFWLLDVANSVSFIILLCACHEELGGNYPYCMPHLGAPRAISTWDVTLSVFWNTIIHNSTTVFQHCQMIENTEKLW